MRARAALISFLIALTACAAAAAPAKRVYRIDGATATVEHRRLVVKANGAVRTGGWENPRLRPREISAPETSTLEVDFVATPPHARKTVVQAILPVRATLAARLPHTGIAQVKIVSETNSVTVPITP